jgi:hypothetical protein
VKNTLLAFYDMELITAVKGFYSAGHKSEKGRKGEEGRRETDRKTSYHFFVIIGPENTDFG